MATFSEKLFAALQKDESVYDSFVRVCTNNLPNDAGTRYEWLRNNGYIVRDEDDINVYVSKVATRHKPKFKWLYDNLFERFPRTFQNEIDLVVWGCGCGLDLLALYDRAMQQNNPQLWLTVRSITLLDKSEVALNQAKEIAELLFPVAVGKIKTCHCDFTSPETINVQLPSSFLYTPRVHLVSNIVDLLSEDQLKRFAQSQKGVCVRWMYGNQGFNDVIVAFSPEYRNWDWVSTRLKIERYRQAWGVDATDIETHEDEPALCAYAVFTLSSLRKSPPFLAYSRGNTCLRNLVKCRNKCLDEGCDDTGLKGLHKALYKITIGDKNFFDCYEWVDIQAWKDNYGQKHINRLLFVPRGNSVIAACVICLNKPQKDIDNIKKAWEGVFKKHGLENLDAVCFASCTKHLLWQNGIFAGDVDFQQYVLDRPFDYSEAFIINPGDAEPLPELNGSMDKVQREVIYSRCQYRKIRGCAGSGKSTTMMWHGVMTIIRTHTPVLIACKTVTLFNRNAKRMAATLMREIPGLPYVATGLIRFKTLDKVLCEHMRDTESCLWFSKCSRCRGCNHEPIFGCNDYYSYVASRREDDPKYSGSAWRQMDEGEKKKCCEVCVKESIRRLSRKGSSFAAKSEAYGAVLIDEVQSVGPNLVQAVVNLTHGGNRARECYVFCDERQSLNPEAVEVDPGKGKLRVKVPDRGEGYGSWVNLNVPYRIASEFSGRLFDVASRLQSMTIEKYGAVELARVVSGGQMTLSSPGVFSIRRSNGELLGELTKSIDAMKSYGNDTITVICDSTTDVRSLLGREETRNWISTHNKFRSHNLEQGLRMTFRESVGCIHLTTVTLAQGWDFKNVIFICSYEPKYARNVLENVLTGATRATNSLYILDRSQSGWLYEELKDLC